MTRCLFKKHIRIITWLQSIFWVYPYNHQLNICQSRRRAQLPIIITNAHRKTNKRAKNIHYTQIQPQIYTNPIVVPLMWTFDFFWLTDSSDHDDDAISLTLILLTPMQYAHTSHHMRMNIIGPTSQTLRRTDMHPRAKRQAHIIRKSLTHTNTPIACWMYIRSPYQTYIQHTYNIFRASLLFL